MPVGKLLEKIRKKYFFYASLKSVKEEVGSGFVSGSISQRYGSRDPNPHQNVMDPQQGENTAVLHGLENFLFGHAAHQVVIG